MKKILALILALAMALSLVACGGSGKTEQSASSGAASAAGSASASSSASEGEVEETPKDESTSGAAYKVGLVNYVDDASLNQICDNIQSELAAKGAELGVTFEVDYANAQADPTVLNQIGADMIADQMDCIIAVATPVAVVMQAATEDNQIPVVFSAVTDPVGAGLVASMDAPGGNITGTSDALDTTAVLNLAKTANPELTKLGLLYDTAQDSSTAAIKEAKAWCDANSIEYEEKTGSTTDDVKLAAESLIADGVEAVFTPTDNTIMTAELSIYEELAEAGIPHYCGADSFALNGAFCGYGVDYANLGVVTGDMVVDLLVNGVSPAEMPVQTFDNGIASINTDTCQAIGFNLDDIKTAFEPLCTQVIELTTAENFQ